MFAFPQVSIQLPCGAISQTSQAGGSVAQYGASKQVIFEQDHVEDWKDFLWYTHVEWVTSRQVQGHYCSSQSIWFVLQAT